MNRRSFFKKSLLAVAASILGAPIAGEAITETNDELRVDVDEVLEHLRPDPPLTHEEVSKKLHDHLRMNSIRLEGNRLVFKATGGSSASVDVGEFWA